MDVIGKIDYFDLCDPAALGDVGALSGEPCRPLLSESEKHGPSTAVSLAKL
jgi:hypothetical protein